MATLSAIGSLRNSIKDLESRSNSLESLLHLFVALVVIGVVLEVAFVVWEYHEEREDFVRVRFLPQAPNILILCFELLGAVLVAVGVAGELGVDIESGTVQTNLRNKNSELVQLLEGASRAALVIATQNEKDAEGLRKDAEGLKKAAEDEKLARIKLVAEIQPRTLSLKQQQEMADTCKPFGGHALSIFSFTGDTEAARLGLQIAAALGKAKVVVQARVNGIMMFNGAPPDGVAISDFDPGLAKVIHDSLTAARIVSAVVPKRPEEKDMTLTVGVKPFELLK